MFKKAMETGNDAIIELNHFRGICEKIKFDGLKRIDRIIEDVKSEIENINKQYQIYLLDNFKEEQDDKFRIYG